MMKSLKNMLKQDKEATRYRKASVTISLLPEYMRTESLRLATAIQRHLSLRTSTILLQAKRIKKRCFLHIRSC